MKYLFLILISVVTLNASANLLPGFEYIDSKGSLNNKIFTAKNLALRWIEGYRNKLHHELSANPENNRVILYMIQGLQETLLAKQYNENNEECFNGLNPVYMFAQPWNRNFNKNHIYVCGHSFDHTINQLAQYFVHESYHLYEFQYLKNFNKLAHPIIVNGRTVKNIDASEQHASAIETLVLYHNGFQCVFKQSDYMDKFRTEIENLAGAVLDECTN